MAQKAHKSSPLEAIEPNQHRNSPEARFPVPISGEQMSMSALACMRQLRLNFRIARHSGGVRFSSPRRHHQRCLLSFACKTSSVRLSRPGRIHLLPNCPSGGSVPVLPSWLPLRVRVALGEPLDSFETSGGRSTVSAGGTTASQQGNHSPTVPSDALGHRCGGAQEGAVPH
jgi:hypothetical protein